MDLLHILHDIYCTHAYVYEILRVWWIYRYGPWPSIQFKRNYRL